MSARVLGWRLGKVRTTRDGARAARVGVVRVAEDRPARVPFEARALRKRRAARGGFGVLIDFRAAWGYFSRKD